LRAFFVAAHWGLIACVAPVAIAVQMSPSFSAAAEASLVQQVVQVADDVYMFSMTAYNSMFIVTDEGVILVDPIGNTRAPALKAAVASVTDKPVRYVVYAHDHADHISGGDVFADTAQFVSQQNAVGKILARADGQTPVPTITFDDFMSLTLGGKTVELYYVGLGHSDNNLLLVYPDRRLAFGADFIEPQSVFTSFGFSPWIDEWADSFNWIYDNIDFDTLVAGHGPVGSKETFREARAYFDDFMASVRGARAAGLADRSPEMVSYVHDGLAPRYGTWAHFEDRVEPGVSNLIQYWANRAAQ